MEVVGAAASIVAVIQIAASVASTLKDYYEAVRDARDEIQRLYQSIKSLQEIVEAVQRLNTRYETSFTLSKLLTDEEGPLKSTLVELERLENKLGRAPKPNERTTKWLRLLRWPFEKGDVEKIVIAIRDNRSTLTLQFSIENVNLGLESFDILNDIKAQIQSARLDQEYQQVVEWLAKSVPDPSTEHNMAREKHQATTGSWLVESHAFKTWMDSKNSLFRLTGGAGTGKSLLCSTVIEHTKELCKEEPGAAVAYWYFSFTEEAKQNVQNLLCSFVTDICSNRRDTPQALKEEYKRSNQGRQRPTTERLKRMLKEVMEGFRNIYLIVDALDECPKSNSKRSNLLGMLQTIFEWQIDQVHIFVTSRPEADIEKAFRRLHTLPGYYQVIEARGPQVTQDIAISLSQWLQGDDFDVWTPEWKEEVKKELITRADGMFRLAALQLMELSNHYTIQSIRTTINTFPTTLYTFYDRMLQDIKPAHRLYVISALKWLAYSMRVLSLPELAEAMIVRPPDVDNAGRFPDSKVVLEMLPSGLITTSKYQITDQEEEIVRIQLAHSTVLDYLKSCQIQSSPGHQTHEAYRLLETDAQWFMLKSCLAYIRYYDAEASGKSGSERYPLLLYACKYWSCHAMTLCCDTDQHIIQAPAERLTELLTELHGTAFVLSTRAALSFETYSSNNRLPRGLRDLLKGLKGEDYFMELAFDFESDSALVSASGMGHKELVKLLIDGGVNVNSRNRLGQTALLWAAAEGHEAVVKLILATDGIDLNSKDTAYGQTPLSRAAMNGHEAVVKLMLATDGVDLDSKDTAYGRTPLSWAAAEGHEAVVKLLLAMDGVNLDSRATACLKQHSMMSFWDCLTESEQQDCIEKNKVFTIARRRGYNSRGMIVQKWNKEILPAITHHFNEGIFNAPTKTCMFELLMLDHYPSLKPARPTIVFWCEYKKLAEDIVHHLEKEPMFKKSVLGFDLLAV